MTNGVTDHVYTRTQATAAGGTEEFVLTNLVADTLYDIYARAVGNDEQTLAFVGKAYISTYQNGTWLNPASGDWSDSSNWLDGRVASGIGATAYFANSAVSESIAMISAMTTTVGRLVISNTLSSTQMNWTVKGTDGGALRFDNDGIGGTSYLDFGPNTKLDLRGFVGSSRIEKSGTGVLRLPTANSSAAYSGRLHVKEGNLELASSKCLYGMSLELGGGDSPVRIYPSNVTTINNGTIFVNGASTNDVSICWDVNNSIQFAGSVVLNRCLTMNNRYLVHFIGKLSGDGGLRLIGGGTVLIQRYEGAVGPVVVSKGELNIAQFTAPVNYSAMTFGDEETGSGNVGIRIGEGDQSKVLTLGADASLHFTDKGTGNAYIGTRNVNGSPLTIKAPILLDRRVVISNTGAAYSPDNSKWGLTVEGVVSGKGGFILSSKSSSNTICIKGANTYEGGTSVTNGFVRILTGGTLGTGDVEVIKGAQLQLSNGKAINDAAQLRIVDGPNSCSKINLDEGVTETVGSMSINGKEDSYVWLACFDAAVRGTVVCAARWCGQRGFFRRQGALGAS